MRKSQSPKSVPCWFCFYTQATPVPAEARAAAQPGRSCCLLWPQDYAPPMVSRSRRATQESPDATEAGQQQQGTPRDAVSLSPSGMQSPFWSAPWASLAAAGGAAAGGGAASTSWDVDGTERSPERDGDGSVQSFVEPLRSLVSSMAAALGQGAVSVMGSPEEQETVGEAGEGGGGSMMGWEEVERGLGEGPGLPGNVAGVQGDEGSQTGQPGIAVHPPLLGDRGEQGGEVQGGDYGGLTAEEDHETSSGELVVLPQQAEPPSDSQGATQLHPSQQEPHARQAGLVLPGTTPLTVAKAGAAASASPGARASQRPVVVLSRQQYVRLLAGVLCRRAEGVWTGACRWACSCLCCYCAVPLLVLLSYRERVA
eukprot:1138877-Pelagomonas_calceolata.AAC.9